MSKNSPASISGEQEVNPGLDYLTLRAEGVKAVQDLTGSFWTDYNEHDPGVTILEQLCYALTDLSYRTQFDIQDHLYNHPEDDTFLKAHEILPCNALTVNDYRKLIFDLVFELKNVWIQPLSSANSSFRGLYKVLIDVDSTVKGDENRRAVVEKTRKVIANNRNICEDFEEITLLNSKEVEVFADIEVDGIKDIEGILAQLYFKVSDYLSPEIKFYSLQELLQEGFELKEIFNGPLLKHGFIKTSELQPKPNKILISEIIKIIMQIPGVMSVKNLYLKVGDKRFDNQVDIDENSLPKLITSLNSSTVKGIQFFRGAVSYSSIDTNLVKRKLNELQSVNKRVYRLSEETISIPLGKKLSIENYYSIQNQFPLVYGIGHYGLPNSADTLRKAQAKQLKGYLLLFEQILANYLSQLSNAKSLFSLKEDILQTYFYQFLDNVPDVKPLFKERKYEFQEEGGVAINSLNYYKGLPELVHAKDNYLDRRNRFLDYLLAIHGESYTQYSLSQFNYYFNEIDFERHLIKNKTRLLKSLSTINKNRARAFNYLEPSVNTDNITGMEAKISILLGLGDWKSDEVASYKAHSMLKHFNALGLKLIYESEDSPEFEHWTALSDINVLTSEDQIEEEFDYIDLEDADRESLSADESKALVYNTLPFKSGYIPSAFMVNGIEVNNYRIGKVGEEENYALVYKSEQDTTWKLIGVFETENEAIIAVEELIVTIKDLNIQSEGIHIVEHILVRPDLHDQNHGVLIYDENRKPILRSVGQYSFVDREEVIEELDKHLKDFNNYSVETTLDKDFEIHFKTPDDKYHFVSLEANISVEDTHENMEKLHQFISDKFKFTAFEEKVGLYVKNSHSDRIIPEDFFSYRVSAILPTWSARFSNKEFRPIIEDTIHQQKPANIAIDCIWLDVDQMQTFEKVYYEWMEEMRNPEQDKENMDSLHNQLSELLMSYRSKTTTGAEE